MSEEISREDDGGTNPAGGAISRRRILLAGTALAASGLSGGVSVAQAQPAPTTAPAGSKPNILFIMGDDIGWFNVSAYNMGIMGYRTPNIDRIGREGAVFTDWYGQQSCTAGRAAFITGQSPIRTGLTKVGLPGAELGLGPLDPSVADVMKTLGYATGQFGKNHLGDRNEHLPTMHGFDEFFGNLYHLNAEEEPENPDYPKDPNFRKRVRAARRSQVQGERTRRCDRRSGVRARRQADDREHRRARHQANGDDRRGVSRRGEGLHQSSAESQQTVVLLFQLQRGCTSSLI